MLFKAYFVKTVQFSRERETVVKFDDGIEFTVPKVIYKGDLLKFENIKGNFMITKIVENYDRFEDVTTFYKQPLEYCIDSVTIYTFHIIANIQMNEDPEEICCVPYQAYVPFIGLYYLKPYHYYKSEFVLPAYDLKFTYYITKMNEFERYNIEIYIENPYEDVTIEGIPGNNICEVSDTADVKLDLIFGFKANIFSVEKNQTFESLQNPLSDESRPESVIPSQKLYRIGSNIRYSDIFFIASEGTKIHSHRCILAEVSTACAKIFEDTKECPVKINVDDFDAETIQSALNFCYDKHDAIAGKEIEVFKFAKKYGFQSLVDACILFFEVSVDPSNVCEIVQIAYANKFNGLKNKCLMIMFENRTEIDALKIADLPKIILLDAFRFKI